MSALGNFIRRFLPWIVIVLGAILAILGVASRTVWAPDPFWTASLKPSEDERLVISDPGMLNLAADQVTVSATVVDGDDLTPEPEGESQDEDDSDEEIDQDAEPGVVISIARDVDATGWIDGSQALRLTGLKEESILKSSQVSGKLESAAAVNSDLWHEVASGVDKAELSWTKEPGRWSIVIAASPTKKISQVSFTWPQSTATPMATPLILIGAVLILAGAVLLVFPQVLDRDARTRAFTALREKARSSKIVPPPTGDGDRDETEAAAEPETDDVPKLEDYEEESQTESEPEVVTEPAQPAQRFTPGTMTRRQIRELERARQGAARATESPAAEAQSETPGASEDQNGNTDAQDSPTIRSQQWRKTWGFLPEDSDEETTSAWLPKSVEDEEGRDE